MLYAWFYSTNNRGYSKHHHLTIFFSSFIKVYKVSRVFRARQVSKVEMTATVETGETEKRFVKKLIEKKTRKEKTKRQTCSFGLIEKPKTKLKFQLFRKAVILILIRSMALVDVLLS